MLFTSIMNKTLSLKIEHIIRTLNFSVFPKYIRNKADKIWHSIHEFRNIALKNKVGALLLSVSFHATFCLLLLGLSRRDSNSNSNTNQIFAELRTFPAWPHRLFCAALIVGGFPPASPAPQKPLSEFLLMRSSLLREWQRQAGFVDSVWIAHDV